MKLVKTVPPYMYNNVCNFKSYAFNAWVDCGGLFAASHYPCLALHGLCYRYLFPSILRSRTEARLRFVSGYSVNFDTFPDYIMYEIIPVIWDCWPKNVPSVRNFFNKCNVRTAIFTSSQTAELFRNLYPNMNILTITEGVDVSLFDKGYELKQRTIDVLEVGRSGVNFFKSPLSIGINHIKTGNFNRIFKSDEEYREALANTKIMINVPRCDVDIDIAGNIETLTQRYWECMLSRVLMVGRAPRELIDLIGYDPVVHIDRFGKYDINNIDLTSQICDMLKNIGSYQDLVDKNYEMAIKHASWDLRVMDIMNFLHCVGYKTCKYANT